MKLHGTPWPSETGPRRPVVPTKRCGALIVRDARREWSHRRKAKKGRAVARAVEYFFAGVLALENWNERRALAYRHFLRFGLRGRPA